MAQPSRSGRKVVNSLVAAGSVAVLAVYAAGYVRTQSAAELLEGRALERSTERRAPIARPALPEPSSVKRDTAPAVKAAVVPSAKAVESREPAEMALKDIVTAQPSATPVPVSAAAIPQAAEPVPVEHKPEPAPPAPPTPPVWKDGTYTGWGTSRHGDIQASVVIEGGKIASATIAQCLTRYSCSVIEKLPPQVAQRQSPEVDFVSGATQSTNAFYYAVTDALSKAK